METVLILAALAAVVLTGGCVVIQSIFRISVIEKIQSFGQLRTIEATGRQLHHMVKREGRQLAWRGILIGIAAGLCLAGILIPKGFHAAGYAGISGIGHGNLGMDSAMMFLPEKLFRELLPGIDNCDYSWDIISNPARDEEVEAALQDIVDGNLNIGLDKFEDKVSYNKLAYSMVFHILQAVAVLISLLGVINLINTTLSNQASRRLETGALRCVGLTKKQRYRMFVCEGMCYTVWSALLTVGAGLPILADVHYKLSGIVYGMQLPILFLFYIWHCMWRFCSGCNSCYRHGQYEDRRNRPS